MYFMTFGHINSLSWNILLNLQRLNGGSTEVNKSLKNNQVLRQLTNLFAIDLSQAQGINRLQVWTNKVLDEVRQPRVPSLMKAVKFVSNARKKLERPDSGKRIKTKTLVAYIEPPGSKRQPLQSSNRSQ